jgi:predicted DNA-binding protein (MmcQ/YjbR family)
MDIDWLRKLCLSLPATSEDVKWGNDLTFMVAGKMFCVTDLANAEKISFKVTEEQFEELTNTEAFIPAPYLARAHWVCLTNASKISKKELEKLITCSYDLIKNKLPRKTKNEFGLQ